MEEGEGKEKRQSGLRGVERVHEKERESWSSEAVLLAPLPLSPSLPAASATAAVLQGRFINTTHSLERRGGEKAVGAEEHQCWKENMEWEKG